MTPESSALPPAYVPFERQYEFHTCPALYRLYGGALGGGKTDALRWEAINQCLNIPNWNALILRKHYDDLEQNHIQRMRSQLPAEMYRWNGTKLIATFPNNSTLRFSYCDKDDDVYRFMSDEYGFIGFDELTQFSLFQWQYMMTRNRSTTGFRPNMAGATNPPGPGHVWVKALWIKKCPAPGMEKHEYNADDYAFIPAKLSDNPYLREDKEYVGKLERIPAPLRKALLEGSWDLASGQFFDCWNENVVRRVEIQPWWARWIGGDWGWRHDSAILWLATDDNAERIHVYRELVIPHTPPKRLAEDIVRMSRGEKIDAFYFSHDAFAEKTAVHTIASEMGEVMVGEGLPCPTRCQNARESGWMQLYQMIVDGTLTIDPSCKALIECVPELQHDDEKPGDVIKHDLDNPADALRYGVASRWRSTRESAESRIQKRVKKAMEDHGDPTMAYQEWLLAKQKERLSGAKVIDLSAYRRGGGRLFGGGPRHA